jgi:hypothetical protein
MAEPKQHRRLAPGQEFGSRSKAGVAAAHQLDLALRLVEFGAKALGQHRVVQAGQNFVVVRPRSSPGLKTRMRSLRRSYTP